MSSTEAGLSRPPIAPQTTITPMLQTKYGEPKPADFLIPATPEEHKSIVDRLILGGSLRNEAEQTIVNRKAAFDKACKNFKKNTPKNRTTYKRKSQNPSQSSTQVSAKDTNHGI